MVMEFDKPAVYLIVSLVLLLAVLMVSIDRLR